MVETSSFQLKDGLLTVSGVTPNGQVYEIEITDPTRAKLWAQYLGYSKHSRLIFGPPRGRQKRK